MKYFSLIYDGEIHEQETGKIIPKEAFSKLLSSKEILDKVKEDAKAYMKEIKEECEEIKKKAYEDGFLEGQTQWNKQIEYLQKQALETRHNAQNSILPLALQASKKIVSKELEMNPDTILEIVYQTLKPVIHAKIVKIFVNKEDKKILEEKKSEIRDLLEELQSLHIQERSDIEIGGCIIETEAGIINATLENQWRAMEAAFERLSNNTGNS